MRSTLLSAHSPLPKTLFCSTVSVQIISILSPLCSVVRRMRLFVFCPVVGWPLLIVCSLFVPHSCLHLPRILRCVYSVNLHMSACPQLCSVLSGARLSSRAEPNDGYAVTRSRTPRHSGCVVERGAHLFVVRATWLRSHSAKSQMHIPQNVRCANYVHSHMSAHFSVNSTGGHYTDCLYFAVSCLPL